MNILITGGAGYLGSVLIPKLLARGHKLRILDIGYFGVGHLRSLKPSVEIIREDIFRITYDSEFLNGLIKGVDCIVHLAAISNDPSAEISEDLTEKINFMSTVILAKAAYEKRIRFIFSSSCSVYGHAEDELDEEGPVNPMTVYASSKVKAETILKEMADSTWSPIILRNGTLFGYSPRMRFDLVVNIFSLYSTIYSTIKIFGDGLQWRPFLHVSDCARAFIHFIELPKPRYICYNIAHENLRIIDVAQVFKNINPSLHIEYLNLKDVDMRNYRVSTERMRVEGFKPRISIEQGAEEMIDAIISGLIPDPESIYYRNAKWLKELSRLATGSHAEIIKFMETIAHIRYNQP
ncbi:MAG: SDR family oxidoreductase [Bacteroidetes bacterium]|nr:SDR family oxidoreductase [Rhodothermia bacterium]MCX7906596.1 SDR family oxidoreductase [Bacteroidota bacterium]MDW8285007.1 SDR family oxidoreductase [Bacteroidota bacterium]